MPIPERFFEDADFFEYFESEGSPEIKSAKEDLLNQCSIYLSPKDIQKISQSFDIAFYFHDNADDKNRFRGTGEHFMTHPASVARIIADLYGDATTVCAALFHDTLEDTKITRGQIEKYAGAEVLSAVDTLTKVTGFSDVANERETIAKIYLAFLSDPRGILIKLADRLHNIRTIQGIKDVRKKEKFAAQTLSVFVPLAIKVGLKDWADELTDLSLAVLKPDELRLAEKIKREKYTQSLTYSLFLPVEEAILREVSDPSEVLIEVLEVPLHTFVAFQRSERISTGDLRPVRVVCKDEADFRKVTAYLKKYKPNADWVIYSRDNQLECRFCYGDIEFYLTAATIEAFAKSTASLATLYQVAKTDDEFYQLQRKYAQILLERPQMLLSQALDKEDARPQNWVEEVQEGMKHRFIEILTPQKERRVVYEGATAWDFAFSLFSEIGLTAEYAIINGERQNLQTVLKEGDQVEIFCSRKGWTISVQTIDTVQYPGYKKMIGKNLRRILSLWENLKRGIIDGVPSKFKTTGIGSVDELEEKAREIILDAQDRGKRRLLEFYSLKCGGADKENKPLVDLKKGWQETGGRFHKRFGSYENFLLDCGLERVEEEAIASYVEKIIEYEKKLPNIRLLVPDRRGVIARLTAIAALSVNIVNVGIEHNLPGQPAGLSEISLLVDVVNYDEFSKVREVLDIFAAMMRERYTGKEEIEEEGNSFFSCQADRNIGPYIAAFEGLGMKILGIKRKGENVVFEMQPFSKEELLRSASPRDLEEIKKLLTNLRSKGSALVGLYP